MVQLHVVLALFCAKLDAADPGAPHIRYVPSRRQAYQKWRIRAPQLAHASLWRHWRTMFGNCEAESLHGFDISDPYNPKRLDVVTDVGFAYWHSATFNNDGTKVIFTDEWGGGGRARCRAWDPLDWGADAIYDIVDNKLEFKSHYKMPAPQLETENCVAHNGSIIPIPNKDIFVQAWYQGGISIIDFTDSSKPVEIAYFDRGPILEDILITGGYWSTYYYDGFIYGTEITRGLDVFKLTPSEYLSEEEIFAASTAYPAIGSKVFNPQQQIPMEWPENASE